MITYGKRDSATQLNYLKLYKKQSNTYARNLDMCHLESFPVAQCQIAPLSSEDHILHLDTERYNCMDKKQLLGYMLLTNSQIDPKYNIHL